MSEEITLIIKIIERFGGGSANSAKEVLAS